MCIRDRYSTDPTAYVANGYYANETEGKYVVSKVAQVEEQSFTNLEEAIAALPKEGGTIELKGALTLTDNILIPDTAMIQIRGGSINPGGKKITVSGALSLNGVAIPEDAIVAGAKTNVVVKPAVPNLASIESNELSLFAEEVAIVNGTYYNTLSEAVNAANAVTEQPVIVKLLNDVDLEASITLTTTAPVTLDLSLIHI